VKHRDVRDRLGDYLEGALPLEDRALLDAHLDACDGCASELEDLRTTVRLLRALSAIDEPADVTAAVMRRLAEGEGQPTLWTRVLDSLDAWARPQTLVAVAVGAAALAGVVIFRPDGMPRPMRPSEPQLHVVEQAATRPLRAALPSPILLERALGTARAPEPPEAEQSADAQARPFVIVRAPRMPFHLPMPRGFAGSAFADPDAFADVEVLAHGLRQPHTAADLYTQLMEQRAMEQALQEQTAEPASFPSGR
jgi:hypothetical protein